MDQLNTASILKPVFERNDDRGRFVEVINEGKWEGIYHGNMKAGARLGGVYHLKTNAFFFLKSGRAEIEKLNVETGAKESFVMESGHGTHFPTNHVNVIQFLADSDFILLKSRKYDPKDPDSYHYSPPGQA